MSDSKDTLHTPPPWKVDSYWDGSFKITRDLEPGFEPPPRYRREYDRRLIEAAPKMYELLVQVLSLVEQDSNGGQTYDSYVYASGISREIASVITAVRGEL